MDDLKRIAAANISQRLEAYISEHDTTMFAVAQEIGCSRTALYQKLSGKSTFSLFEGYRLSQLFGCNVSDFFTAA